MYNPEMERLRNLADQKRMMDQVARDNRPKNVLESFMDMVAGVIFTIIAIVVVVCHLIVTYWYVVAIFLIIAVILAAVLKGSTEMSTGGSIAVGLVVSLLVVGLGVAVFNSFRHEVRPYKYKIVTVYDRYGRAVKYRVNNDGRGL